MAALSASGWPVVVVVVVVLCRPPFVTVQRCTGGEGEGGGGGMSDERGRPDPVVTPLCFKRIL